MPEILDTGLLDDLQHPILSSVVCRQGQMPITEHLVEVVQIAGRGASGLFRIVSLVASARFFQAVSAARGAHELPDACGPGDGLGIRVVGALDQPEIDQILRHTFLPENFSHHLLVPIEPAESDSNAVPPPATKVIDKLLDLPVAGDCDMTVDWHGCVYCRCHHVARESQEILSHARCVKYFFLD